MNGLVHTFVLGVIALVALLDGVVGVRLLTSPEPWLVNGAGTLWARDAPALWSGASASLIRSLYRRLGAFSVHTAAVTAVWAWLGRDDSRAITTLFVVYTATGLAFAANDREYFRGTRYFAFKQVIGGLWALAFLAHLFAR